MPLLLLAALQQTNDRSLQCDGQRCFNFSISGGSDDDDNHHDNDDVDENEDEDEDEKTCTRVTRASLATSYANF